MRNQIFSVSNSGQIKLFIYLSAAIAFGLFAAAHFYSAASAAQPLSFDERVRYERRVQEVYFKLRARSTENKGTFDNTLPVEVSRARVAEILQKSNALEKNFNVRITPEMLQAETKRMSRETRQPEVLREIFAALDDNPRVIAECLARPNLVERLAGDNSYFKENWQTEQHKFSTEIAETPFVYEEPEIVSDLTFEDDSWKAMPVLPEATEQHTAVWTGAEMLVWGGTQGAVSGGGFNSGSRYNPATDMWLPITGFNAPQPRRAHTAVWTGAEMIVWGGCGRATQFCGLGDGGRYNPATDSWVATSQTNAPTPRLDHTAVWTGDRMIIWGGCRPNADFSNCINQPLGGMYFPATDTWTTVNAANFGRRNHTAVWTGGEMLVWGGFSNVGERFNPNTNSWTLMSAANAPSPRERHTAIWTGTEMIVWGGITQSLPQTTLNTGGRYNPATDTWTPTSQTNAPDARYLHTAVWTGTEMIIWGGAGELFSAATNTGGRYNPANDTWTPTNTANSPNARAGHEAVWTGTEMIVWGGWSQGDNGRAGGRYNPATDSWILTGTNDAPPNASGSEGIWTGAELIVFGGSCCGNTGAKFNPATAIWTPIRPLNEIPQRNSGFTLIWTGTEMIVWGGGATVLWNDGARYNPAADSWTVISQSNAPGARTRHTAVWTGSEMIIWGGLTNTGRTNTGGRYNPANNSWTPITTVNAPEGRDFHTTVVVGNQMLVWGGIGASGFLNSGGRYNFTDDSWQAISTANAPSPRYFHTAISTGTEMIIWGGRFTNADTDSGLNTGGRYNPITNVWTATSTSNAPSPRSRHTAVWTGAEMIIYAGNPPSFFQYLNTGGRYNPATDSWRATTLFKVGTQRADHIAVWTGRSMLVWGGSYQDGDSRAGYEYFAQTNARTRFDFDGDGRADVSVYREGVWHLLNSANGYSAAQFGLSSDKITPADYDGDGKTDLAVYRDGVWYILQSSNAQVRTQQFGLAGDIPQARDFDGDGKADLAVFRPSDRIWYLLQSTNGFSATQFGSPDDKPVAADFDGDGKTDIALYRASSGVWHILRSRDGYTSRQYGISTDKPVPADYDGDGKTDLAIYRDGVWWILRSTGGDSTVQFGLSTDKPVAADYDGDGKADVAVFRDGVWYLQRSTAGFTALQFGIMNDKPTPAAFAP